jgi:hypothetical protein
VRILSPENLSKESDEAPDKLKENRKLLNDPLLSDEDKKVITQDIDKIEKEEKTSQADLTKQTLSQLKSKLEQLSELRKWMNEDAKQNKTILRQ